MRAVARATALVLAGMLVMGCGDGGTEPAADGSFSGTLSGDLTGSKSGKTELIDEDGIFSVQMTAGSGSNAVHFGLMMPSDPDAGTYDVEDGFFDAALYSEATDTDYYAVSGTLTITSSSATSVSGSFNITMESDFGETVTFKGTFSAKIPTAGGGGPLANGTFTATFSGSASGSANGFAFFGVESGMWVLTMGNTTGTRAIQIVRGVGGRPGTGSFSVGNFDSDNYASLVLDGDPDAGGYYSTSGTVNITGSTSSLVTGTFTIQLENFDGGTVSLSGSFKATCPSGSSCS